MMMMLMMMKKKKKTKKKMKSSLMRHFDSLMVLLPLLLNAFQMAARLFSKETD